ncbi:MAG: hypothetical protein WC878_05435 [Candidatus Paceibacterota bacterium]|jgi:hypothetical protein
MKTKISIAAFLFAAWAFVPVLFISAQTAENNGVPPTEQEKAYVAALPPDETNVDDVGVYDIEVISRKDNVFTVAFNVVNNKGVQPQVIYGINLMRSDEEFGLIAVDQKVYADDVLTLGPGESIRKEITYTAPSYLSGTYYLEVQIKNPDGRFLGTIPTDEFSLKGSGESILSDSSACFLTIDGDKNIYGDENKYGVREGIDFLETETLVAHCALKHNFKTKTSVTPVFETHYRSVFGKIVGTVKGEAIELIPGKTFDFSANVPKMSEPQAYDAVLTFVDVAGKQVSSPVAFHYVLKGQSATINNIVLDKDYYAKGDTALVTLIWSGPADGFPNSRLKPTAISKDTAFKISIQNSEDKSCIADFSKLVPLTISGGVEHLSLPITENCPNPVVSVKISDAAGKVLAENSYDIKSKIIPAIVPSQKNLGPVILLGLAILLTLIGLVIYYMKKKKTPAAPIAIFFAFLCGFGMLSFAGETKAANYTATYFVHSYGGWEGNFSSTFRYDFDKTGRIYYPGNTIKVTGSFDSGVCDNTLGGKIEATINGQTANVYNSKLSPAGAVGLHTGYAVTTSYGTFTAPNTPGEYVAVFDNYHGLYDNTGTNSASWIIKSGGAKYYGTLIGERTIPSGLNKEVIYYVAANGNCGAAAHTYPQSATGFDGGGKCDPYPPTVTPVFPAAGSSVTWTCPGAFGGTSKSCTAYHSKNGVCSSTSGQCTAGTSSGGGSTACGTTRNWTCYGVYDGTDAPCSYANPPCVVNGSCNNTVALGCNAGTSSTDNGATSCGTTRTWHCDGSGTGHTDATNCAKANRTCDSCNLDGITKVHGASYTFFSATSVGYGNLCSSIDQFRTCVDGSFDGSDTYQYAGCTTNAATNPTNPTISVAGNCLTTTGIVNVPKTFTFTGTDTNTPKLTIRYGADWNKDTAIDFWTSPNVSSGTGQAVSHTWTSVGATSFQVLTENSQTKRSGWTSCNIDIKAAAALGSGCRDYTKTETKFDAVSLMCAVGTPVHGDGSAFSGSAPYNLPPAGDPLDYKCNNGVGNDSPICAFMHTNITCGSAVDVTEPVKPKTNLCSDGSTPLVTLQGGKWTWTCGGVVTCTSPKGKFNFVES